MKIGLSTAGFYGRMETEEAAAYVNSFGAQVCEVFLQTFSEYDAAFGDTVRKALGETLCLSVHPKGTQFEPDLFSASPRQRKDALALMENVLKAAQRLGAQYYVFHGPADIHLVKKPLTLPGLGEVLPKLLKLCEAYGVRILWENVSWCTLRTPQNVQELKTAFPQLGFVLDLKQALRAGQDALEMARAMGENLCHLHVMDWDEEGNLCLPGEGVFDFPALKKELDAIGYQGAVILEPYAPQTEDAEKVAASLDYLKKVFIK